MALRKAGAIAFSVRGDIELAINDDPILLFKTGQLPQELSGDDG
jgi:hypothetical protein